MARADEPADVLEVGREHFDAAALPAEIAPGENDADHAVRVGDRADLFVVDVAPERIRGVDACMADDDRAGGKPRRIQERFAADVSEVHDHADPVHFADHLLAEIGERLVAVGADASAGRAQLIPGEMAESEGADAGLRKGAHVFNASFEVVAALDSEQRGDSSFAFRAADVVGRRGEDHAVLRAGLA